MSTIYRTSSQYHTNQLQLLEWEIEEDTLTYICKNDWYITVTIEGRMKIKYIMEEYIKDNPKMLIKFEVERTHSILALKFLF